MSRFTFSEGSFGKYPTVTLNDTLSGSEIEIALRGATLLSYNIPTGSGLLNIVDGYASPRELEEQSGARSCIMAPFSNRIENGSYVFNNVRYQMTNPVDPNREVIHGFARVLDFKVKDIHQSDEHIAVTLFSDAIRKNSFGGYPFCVDIEVIFTLSADKLNLEITGRNMGSEPLPFGCGWHPYFRTGGGGVDHLILNLPARRIIAVDDKLLPLKGDAAFINVEDNPEADFRPHLDEAQRVIGSREVNYCYSELEKDRSGLIVTSIKDPDSGLKIRLLQPEGVVYAYSADGARYRPRKSIALEPVQYITNAYNRDELKDKISLEPGKSVKFSFGVEYSFEPK